MDDDAVPVCFIRYITEYMGGGKSMFLY